MLWTERRRRVFEPTADMRLALFVAESLTGVRTWLETCVAMLATRLSALPSVSDTSVAALAPAELAAAPIASYPLTPLSRTAACFAPSVHCGVLCLPEFGAEICGDTAKYK